MTRYRPGLRRMTPERAREGNDFYARMAGKEPGQIASVLPTRKPRAPRQKRERSLTRVSEADVNADISLFTNRRRDIRLWRNNRGLIDLPNGGKLRYGVGPNGASDWIGYRKLIVTKEMIGITIAQFVACEAKAPDAKSVPEHQTEFLSMVAQDGGVAFVARSAHDAERELSVDDAYREIACT